MKKESKKKNFEFIEHTADLKFKAWGKTIDEVFENCALAFSSIISRDKNVKKAKKRKIQVSGEDIENLLYNFIDELIYLLDANGFVVSGAKVKITDKRLDAEVFGDDAKNYEDLDQVKAATYAEMYVKKLKKGAWEAQVVVDV